MRGPDGEFTILFSSARRKKNLNSPEGSPTEKNEMPDQVRHDERASPGMTKEQAGHDGAVGPCVGLMENSRFFFRVLQKKESEFA